jgi:hypothetical protein
MVSMQATVVDGYKANRWTKEINGKNFDRFYIDAPNGEKLGSFELNGPNQGQFVGGKESNTVFGVVDEEEKAKVTIEGPGGFKVLLGITGRVNAAGESMTREEQITMGMCMNCAARVVAQRVSGTDTPDDEIAEQIVSLAHTLYNCYV